MREGVRESCWERHEGSMEGREEGGSARVYTDDLVLILLCTQVMVLCFFLLLCLDFIYLLI